MSDHWVRFSQGDAVHFGKLRNEQIEIFEGNVFDTPFATGRLVPLSAVTLLTPVQPTKVIAMWNNFHALAAKLNLADPPEPLYLIKSPNSYMVPGGVIRKPPGDGKVVYEGELGIVIGKRASRISLEDAPKYVFGYTCANDVTVADILHRDASFPQWVRAKGFDTFCPFGPAVATALDPAELVVRTLLNGEVRQAYPISDMRFSVAQLVSLISHDMTLEPGDIILCGTSVGVGSMKTGSTVEVEIAGIGTLSNKFQ